MAEFRVRPAKPIACSVTVPGDKSISHRSVMIASLADGVSVIDGFLASEDCLATMNAFRAMGVRIDVPDEETLHRPDKPGVISITVHGSPGGLRAPAQAIDCGNSGTTMRLMSGLLAAQAFRSELFGDASLSRRPMKRVIDPLARMGAKISGQGENGLPPLVIDGGPLTPIHYRLPVASAQVKSAVLLAGLFCQGKTTVTEPVPTRDHTERMFEVFGISLRRDGDDIILHGGQWPVARAFTVPGDVSSAAFWLVAAAAQPGSRLEVVNVGLNPTRTGILKVLARMGAHVQEIVETKGPGEPAGRLIVHGTRLRATTIGGAEIPNVIDELPILAVAAALAEGTTIIRDAQELRVKETDRIAAVAGNLRAMGVVVREREDGMEIDGPARLHAPAAPLPTFGDHRIAMAGAIAGLFAEGETVVSGVECVDTSYPGFGRELARFQSDDRTPPAPRRVVTSAPAALRQVASPPAPSREAGGAPSPAAPSKPPLVIAIDGPAASGKSTVARLLAQRLGWVHVNSGALYRAVTRAVLEAGVDPSDAGAVEALLPAIRLECGEQDGHGTVRLGGVDVGPMLNSPEINAAVSQVARHAAVRSALYPWQRRYAEKGGVVREGRAIGSAIFPETPYKYYIDASPEVRAGRRAAQGLQDEVADRDRQDSTRDVAPLCRAEGALVVDSSEIGVEEVTDCILTDLRSKGLAV
jgi:3-phosphoshikimate 1-carboxyvinyltransferase